MDLFSFLKSIFKRDSAASHVFEQAEKFRDVAGIFLITLSGANLEGFEWVEKEPEFVAGYMQGFGDVLAQAAGESPGSMLGGNIAIQFIKVILADAKNDDIRSFIQYSLTAQGASFDSGISCGERDGNGFLQRKSHLPRALVEHLGI